jgi:putative flippase GtrA
MIKKIIENKHAEEFIKYFIVSFFAVLIDYLSYWFFFKKKLFPQIYAGSLGYLTGLIFAYFLIKRFVFKKTWLEHKKTTEVLLFFISGAIGIITTFLTIFLYQKIVLEQSHMAKIIATPTSFTIVYFFRKLYVFKHTK